MTQFLVKIFDPFSNKVYDQIIVDTQDYPDKRRDITIKISHEGRLKF